jgi:hypothetical protein
MIPLSLYQAAAQGDAKAIQIIEKELGVSDGRTYAEDKLTEEFPTASVHSGKYPDLEYYFQGSEQVRQGEAKIAADEIVRITRDLSPGSKRDAFKLPEPDLRTPEIQKHLMKIAARDPFLAFDALTELENRGLLNYHQRSLIYDQLNKVEDAGKDLQDIEKKLPIPEYKEEDEIFYKSFDLTESQNLYLEQQERKRREEEENMRIRHEAQRKRDLEKARNSR